MADRAIPCRVCGKLFVPCNKSSNALGAFNYREVACSPECGAEYLRRVQAARQKITKEVIEQNPPDATVSTDVTDNNKKKQTTKRVRGQRRKAPIIEEAMI